MTTIKVRETELTAAQVLELMARVKLAPMTDHERSLWAGAGLEGGVPLIGYGCGDDYLLDAHTFYAVVKDGDVVEVWISGEEERAGVATLPPGPCDCCAAHGHSAASGPCTACGH